MVDFLFGNVMQQRHVPCALDGSGQQALVRCARSRRSAWNDLAALGDELAQLARGLVIDGGRFFNAE